MVDAIVPIALFLLLSASALTALSSALQAQGRLQAEENLKRENSPLFFRHVLSFFFGKQKWEGLLFSLRFTKHFLTIGFALLAFFFIFEPTSLSPLIAILILIIGALFLDFIADLFGRLLPKATYRLCAAFCSLILYLFLPITALFFRWLKPFLSKKEKEKKAPPSFRIRDKVYELLQETELSAYLDPTEQKLILSVVSFKERIAREVMVPRINLFSLDVDTTVAVAAENFAKEGYSRIPVYKESVDNIIGVLLYKDILNLYIGQDQTASKREQTIEKLVKPVLYAPETKKISHLLQEFRNKQTHLAIVVDEWGGTEGIVTIEDILEELVGEIADEYDTGQPSPFTALPGGGWIVDAKMSIIDIQEELNVRLPLSPEYDTIGGYVVDRAGTIPSKGWRIHHDDFDLEVISSTERALNKIKILPHH